MKIYMSLVREIEGEPTEQELIRGMATICGELGMLFITEGVETSGERDMLLGLGCDLFKGTCLRRRGELSPP